MTRREEIFISSLEGIEIGDLPSDEITIEITEADFVKLLKLVRRLSLAEEILMERLDNFQKDHIARRRVVEATEEYCECGGGHPDDDGGCCTACAIYHMLRLGLMRSGS